MKRNVLLLILIAVIALPFPLSAQKKNSAAAPKTGHNIVFNIPKAQDSIVYLAVYYRDKLILKDSARVTKTKNGPQFIFKGDNEYQGGLYKLVSQTHYPYMDFIMDGPQFFSFTCGTTGTVDSVSVTNSPHNEELMAFQRKTTTAGKQMSEWRKAFDEAKKADNQKVADEYQEKMKSLNEEMETFIKDIIARHPDYLFSKIQNAYQQIDIPDAPVNADGSIDSTFQLRYFLTHYWDKTDLGDSRLIFTPVLEPKLKEYFTKYLQYKSLTLFANMWIWFWRSRLPTR